jgi:hypothetical protein
MSMLSKPDLIVDGVLQRISAGLDMESYADELSLDLVGPQRRQKESPKMMTNMPQPVGPLIPLCRDSLVGVTQPVLGLLPSRLH